MGSSMGIPDHTWLMFETTLLSYLHVGGKKMLGKANKLIYKFLMKPINPLICLCTQIRRGKLLSQQIMDKLQVLIFTKLLLSFFIMIW